MTDFGHDLGADHAVGIDARFDLERDAVLLEQDSDAIHVADGIRKFPSGQKARFRSAARGQRRLGQNNC